MIPLSLLLLLPLHAAEYRVVHLGDSVESIADTLGEPTLAAEIRALNRIEPAAQPAIGALLELPARPSEPMLERSGMVITLRGEVEVALPESRVLVATAGLELPPGATVCTGADSYATIRLAKVTQGLAHDDVNLLAETCLTLVSAVATTQERSSVIRVERGSVAVRAADHGHGTVVVETESGITAGQGGGFRVTREEGSTRTEALEAPVAVMGAGEQVDLRAGQGSRVRSGEAPSAPVDLLGPGSPVRPQLGEPLRRPDFVWTAVDGALGYRVEIAAASDFSAIVHVESVPDPSWMPALLFLPYRVEGLYWRVSSFDRVGFQGPPSDPRQLVVPPGVGP